MPVCSHTKVYLMLAECANNCIDAFPVISNPCQNKITHDKMHKQIQGPRIPAERSSNDQNGSKIKKSFINLFFLIVTCLIQMLLFVCFFIYVSIYQLGERKQPSQSFVWSKKNFHHNKKHFPSEVIMNACACTATGLMRMQCCKLPSPFCGRRVYKNNISLLLSLQILKNPRP